MSNLQKIRESIASVRKSLAALKLSGNSGDLDKIARERVLLREKLEVLADAESEERARLEAEEAAAKAKQRRVKLWDVDQRANKAEANYNALTERAISLLGDLAVVLAKREQAFSRGVLGLDTHEALDPLTSEDALSLFAAIDRSTVGVYEGQLAATWREVVQRIEDKYLRQRLEQLFPLPGPHSAPFPKANNHLSDTARSLAESEPQTKSEPAPVEPVAAKPVGKRYEVDLREPGPVIDLDDEDE